MPYDFTEVFDVAEDWDEELFLAHGVSLDKIADNTVESLGSLNINGSRPITPIHLDSSGHLHVNGRYIMTPSALAKFK
jgi:hypothetical protein